MRMVIDKHLGGGEWERVGIAEAKAEQRQDTPEAKAEQRQDAPDAVQLWWLRDWMEAESGGNPVPAAFDALDVTEVADYRVYPEGAENSPGFYRLTSDGTIAEIESPTP